MRGDEITFSWDMQQPPDWFPIPDTDRFFGPSAPRQFTARRVADVTDALTVRANAARKAPAVTFDRILNAEKEPQHWLTYSGNLLGHRYSPLTQIAPANIRSLELSWLWQSQAFNTFQATPIVVDGILYTVETPNDVVALEAATGQLLWKFSYTPPHT